MKGTLEKLSKETLPSLRMRLAMCNMAIRLVALEGDPHGVIDKYRDQAQLINDAISASYSDREKAGNENIVIEAQPGSFLAEGQGL